MTRYRGTSEIAARLGVATGTVTKWIDRFSTTTVPFPAPDVEIVETDGRITRGWAAGRWPEIERWATADRHAARFPGRPKAARGYAAPDSVPDAAGKPWEALVRRGR